MSISNQSTALKFSDIHSLWRFAQTIKVPSLEINTHTKTLFCECSPDDIILAVTEFKAMVAVEAGYEIVQ